MAEEKVFEGQVKRYLESIGVYPIGSSVKSDAVGYFEKRWGGGFSKAGLPDLHLVINGINVDVELKASNGRPSELQRHNLIQINRSKSLGILLYPSGFKEFKKIMEELLDCNLAIHELTAIRDAHESTGIAIWTD